VSRRAPRWIEKTALLLLLGESLAEHGGSAGLRDEGLLDSALARPRQLWANGKPDTAQLAAVYAYGIAKNHPFVDGNKRAAFLSIGLFLDANRLRLTADPADATLTMLGVAAGARSEAELAEWLRPRIAAATD
jgi:death-on-curing protein